MFHSGFDVKFGVAMGVVEVCEFDGGVGEREEQTIMEREREREAVVLEFLHG